MNTLPRRTPILAVVMGAALTALPPSSPRADLRTGYVLVANQQSANASLIDLRTDSARLIPVPPGPHEAVISPSGRVGIVTIYGVAGAPGNQIVVIDIRTGAITKTISLGQYTRPHGAVFVKGSDSRVVVTSETTQRLLLLDLATGVVDAAIPTGAAGSHMVGVTADGTRAFTSDVGAGAVSEIDLVARTLVRVIPIAPRVEGIAVTPDGRSVWAGSNTNGTVSVIDPATGAIVDTLKGFTLPYRLAISSDGRTAIICDAQGNKIHVADVATRKVLWSLDGLAAPRGVNISPDGKTAFVTLAGDSTVGIVDLEQRKLTRKIGVGTAPDGVWYGPLSAGTAGAQGPRYDLLIVGGTVIDGTGAARFRADVALSGDRIVLVSRTPISRLDARRVIDATGRIVSPGFIDLHAHLEPLPELPGAESAVTQGVTLALGGPDGTSPWPFAPYLAAREKQGIGINVAYLVGHNTVRRLVMGESARAPSPGELARMRAMIAQGMGEGAFGISTGLFYVPGTYATIDEVVALSQPAADSGGIYTSHLRREGLGLFDGVREAIEIGRRARIPVVLTHHKAVGQQMWGKSVTTLAMLDSARAAGVDVMADVYPYTATHTGISALIPSWALADGDSAFQRRTADPVLKDSITRGIIFNILNDRGGGDLARVQFSRVSFDKSLEGKTLADWAARRGLAPTPENGAALVIEAEQKGGANAIYHVLDERDVRRIMRHPQAMIASDGRLSRPGDGHPHPRAYGTFPRALGHYVRDEHVLTLEQGVHKMTGMPAARLGIGDRGVLRAGGAADIVVFDADGIADKATFEAPHQYATGIDAVIVNGVLAVDRGKVTGSRAGKVLRRCAAASKNCRVP